MANIVLMKSKILRKICHNKNFMSECKCKVTFIGQGGAGKSALIARMVDNTFDSTRRPTIGVQDFDLNVECNDQTISLLLCDTAGQEKWGKIAEFYIRDSDIIVVCFDPKLADAENQLKFWKDIADKHHSKEKQILVSTKSDLWYQNKPLPKLVENPDELPKRFGVFTYFETSSKSGSNVNDLKNGICQLFLNNQRSEKYVDNQTVDINNGANTEKKCSC